jgi:DNA-binding response OmpR family regulator
MQIKNPIIFLVEDSPDDEFFFRSALTRTGIPCELDYAPDGAAAIRHFETVRSPEGARLDGCPDLVFLDLKMPVVSGFDVLTWLRGHPFSPALDVAVLSGSDRAQDMTLAQSLGASMFYVKPLSADRLAGHIRAWQSKQHVVAVSG